MVESFRVAPLYCRLGMSLGTLFSSHAALPSFSFATSRMRRRRPLGRSEVSNSLVHSIECGIVRGALNARRRSNVDAVKRTRVVRLPVEVRLYPLRRILHHIRPVTRISGCVGTLQQRRDSFEVALSCINLARCVHNIHSPNNTVRIHGTYDLQLVS